MILGKYFNKLKLSLKKWWAKIRLKECIKSEQNNYRKELGQLVLERPRLLDMEKSVDALMVNVKQSFYYLYHLIL